MTGPFSRLITKHVSARSGMTLPVFHTLLVHVFIKALRCITGTYSPELWPMGGCAKKQVWGPITCQVVIQKNKKKVLSWQALLWERSQSSTWVNGKLQLRYIGTVPDISLMSDTVDNGREIEPWLRINKKKNTAYLIYGKTGSVIINQEMRRWQEFGRFWEVWVLGGCWCLMGLFIKCIFRKHSH